MSARADADEMSPDEVPGREELPPSPGRSTGEGVVSLQSSMTVSRRDWGRDSDP